MPDDEDADRDVKPSNVIPFPAMRPNAKLAETWDRELEAQNKKLSTADRFLSPLDCLDEIIRRRSLPVFQWPAQWPNLAERARCYPGDVVIVTGPTGAGKTSFGIQVGLSFAGAGIPVVWCALELSPTEITERLVANMHGVHTMAIKEHWPRDRIAHSLAAIQDMWKFVGRIMDTEAQLQAVRRCIAMVYRVYRVKPLVVIDYLGKLAALARDIRTATVMAAELVRALAVEEECFVLEFAQPSRAKNQALTGKTEHASAADTSGSAAESGEAENAASVEINLEVFKEDDKMELDARWHVAKSRHTGREGQVGAVFSKPGGVWRELDYIPVHPMATKGEVEKQKKDKHRTERVQAPEEVRQTMNLSRAADADAARRVWILKYLGNFGMMGVLWSDLLKAPGTGRKHALASSMQELERAGAVERYGERWRLAPVKP